MLATFKKPFTLMLDEGLVAGKEQDTYESKTYDCKKGDVLDLAIDDVSKVNGKEIGNVHVATCWQFIYFKMQSKNGTICKFD